MKIYSLFNPRKFYIYIIYFFLFASWVKSQELNAKVILNTDLMPINIDKRVFNKLQSDLFTLLNQTKWGKDVYENTEKINCNFILNLEQILDANTFSASLIIQATRPVFNTMYQSSLINLADREIIFAYNENQTLEFNEFRIQTNNPLADNLVAIFAFYANIIIGIDNNTFSTKSGMPHFQKALNIVNNAPEHRYINGWSSFNSRRNRYWIVEAFTNVSYNQFHDIYYSYYREGLDHLVEDSKKAIKKIFFALQNLSIVNNENNTNLAVLPLFLQGKTEELIRIFKKEDPTIRKDFLNVIEKLDPSNFISYQRELQ